MMFRLSKQVLSLVVVLLLLTGAVSPALALNIGAGAALTNNGTLANNNNTIEVNGGTLTNNGNLRNAAVGTISISGNGFTNSGVLTSSGLIRLFNDLALTNAAGAAPPTVNLTGSTLSFGADLTLTLDGCDLSGVNLQGGSSLTTLVLTNCTVAAGSGFHSAAGAPIPPPAGSPVVSGTFIWDGGLAGGNGGWRDLSDYKPLYTVADLMKIGVDPAWPRNGHYLLLADLDLADQPEWAPIGGTRFTGIFDGNYHTVAGLTITTPVDQAGLFYEVGPTGEVHRLGLVDVNVSSTTTGEAGGVTGYNYGTVTECFVSGFVRGYSSGGIVGANGGLVENCYVTAEVANYGGSFSYTGGIAGFNNNSINSCYMTGEITTDVTETNLPWVRAGGIVGEHVNGPVENCLMLGGSVTGGDYCGRVIGELDNAGSNNPTLANVSAWEDTLVNGAAVASPSPGGRDGDSLSSAALREQANWSAFFPGVTPWQWNAAAGPPTLAGFGAKNLNPNWP